MKTCSTCKHWEPVYEDSIWANCQKLLIDKAYLTVKDSEQDERPSACTEKDFGCILHEEESLTPRPNS